VRLTVDRLNLLQDHGLSEYQGRVYLALLDFPSLPAGALAKAASIPRNRLYEVIEELQGLGLVEIILGDTRMYRAQPLTAYLDRSMADLRERIDRIEGQKSYLAAAFQPPARVESGDLEVGSTLALLTRRAVAREIDRLVDEAHESLVAIGSEGGWERILQHLSRVQLTNGRSKLDLEVFLPRAAALAGGIERLGEQVSARVRWMSVPTRTLAVVKDGAEMILVHAVPDDNRVRTGRDFAVLTTNPAFVRDHVALVRATSKPPGAAP
jgi:hypothetical protein